jgi:hypothetical protein
MSDQQRQAVGQPFRVSAAAIGTGFLVVATVVLLLAWTGFAKSGAGPVSGATGPGAAPAAVAAPQDSPSATPQRTGVNTRLARCRRAVATLQGPLDAARPAMRQWALHAKAMNRLVDDEITPGRVAAFWKRTRARAQDHVDAFRSAEAVLRTDGVDCPRSDLLAPGSRALPACARQVDADVRLLRSAQASLEMWEHHVHQMERLRLGEVSAQRVSRSWLRTWPRGRRDLSTYRDAARGAREAGGCEVDGAQ